uniref:Uncharacterized protein n=1 Tax=Megaselia scalaris TaxID=36166 RepID=T1GZE3_MEGSC
MTLKYFHGIKCHVGNKEDRHKLFDETIKKYGKLNILVVGAVLDCDEGVWDKIFDTNVKASFMLTKEALPLLRKSNVNEDKNCNSIGFVSSIALMTPWISVGSLLCLPEGIRVNCLSPGIIKTNFSKALHKSESANEAALSKIPMQRLGTKMVGVYSFLVFKDAAYTTGRKSSCSYYFHRRY